MVPNPEVERIARARVARANEQIQHSLKQIERGNPLAAERDPRRLRDRVQAKASMSREEADAIVVGIESLARMKPAQQMEVTRGRGAEAIYGKTIDFVGVSFLERGAAAARAVARVAFRDGRAQGSGLMVTDRLFLTNNHVIGSKEEAAQFCLEFDYELDPKDRPRGPTRFVLDPQTFFLTDPIDDLDFTLIAVGDRLSGPRSLRDFGWCTVSMANNKHALGEVANIVQHPDGRYKEVVLRENRLVARLDDVLHYVADTEPGSSGSPVFNNEWQVIALHHWGGPWRQKSDDGGRPLPREVNEGIRVSSIAKRVRERLSTLDPAARRLLAPLDRDGSNEQLAPDPIAAEQPETGEPQAFARLDSDGTVRWRFPIELSVRLPHLEAAQRPAPAAIPQPVPAAARAVEAEKVKPSKDYSTRSGYKPKFIDGFTVEMPQLTSTQKADAAPNRQAQPGDDPFELKYHHFSVVMNRKRRLAFFTACNIDGSKAKHVNRQTGDVSPLEPDDPRLESLGAAEGAEASETWYDDDRLDPAHCAGREIYERQNVPGFPTSTNMARTLRMFQRGHLVRRMDPAWGTNQQALLADADTFHWTNCSPQVGFFNMGKAANLPGTGGGQLWRAIENYVLRNAVAEQSRISSFTGPIFGNTDRDFRGIKVPKKFWKVVVWSEHGQLRSVAMIADQSRVINVWPERLEEAAEAFGDADELGKVHDFLTTIEKLELMTKLDFGGAVRAADIRAGEPESRVNAFEEIDLRPHRTQLRNRLPRANGLRSRTAAAHNGRH